VRCNFQYSLSRPKTAFCYWFGRRSFTELARSRQALASTRPLKGKLPKFLPMSEVRAISTTTLAISSWDAARVILELLPRPH